MWSADFHGLPWSSVLRKTGAGSPTFTPPSFALSSALVHPTAQAVIRAANVNWRETRMLRYSWLGIVAAPVRPPRTGITILRMPAGPVPHGPHSHFDTEQSYR